MDFDTTYIFHCQLFLEITEVPCSEVQVWTKGFFILQEKEIISSFIENTWIKLEHCVKIIYRKFKIKMFAAILFMRYWLIIYLTYLGWGGRLIW